jgi:aspartate racemase
LRERLILANMQAVRLVGASLAVFYRREVRDPERASLLFDATVRLADGRRYSGSRPSLTPQHIGIVACSAEGAALCYRTICIEGSQRLGAYGHPEVSMHSHSLAEYVACLERDDWHGVSALMLSSAEKLARGGADFLICPDNTIHQAWAYVAPQAPRPWLHIADVVAAEARTRGFRRLGLTGTRLLVQSDVYPGRLTRLGIDSVPPEPDERDEIDRIIWQELVNGRITPGALSYFQRVIGRMKRDGCDAVVLGCTEIPLLVGDAHSPLPTLDSTRLLARAALRRAVTPATT